MINVNLKTKFFLTFILALSIPLSNASTNITGLLLILLCGLSWQREKWRQILKNPVVIAILLFFIINLIRSFTSYGAFEEIIQALRKSSRLLYVPLFLTVFTADNISNQNNVIILRHYVLLGLLSAILLSVFAALLGNGWPVFKDTIYTSMFVSYGVFMAMHYCYEYKQYRFLFAAIALFMSYYLLFINTGRIGQVGLLILLVIFLWQRDILKFKNGIVIVLTTLFLLTATMFLFPNSFVTRQLVAMREVKDYSQTSDKASTTSSMGLRLFFAHNTLTLIKQRPLFGWGTGAFNAAYADHGTKLYDGTKVTNPHNQYLLTWLELGIPGLLCLIGMFFTILHHFFLHKNMFGYLGLGLICLFMVGCGLNSWLLDFTSSFFFLFMLSSLLDLNTNNYQHRLSFNAGIKGARSNI